MNEKTNLTTNFYSCAISYYSPARAFGTSTGWKVATDPNAAYASLAFGASISAINSSGQLFSSGRNTYGTLGDSTTTTKSSPVQTISGGTNWQTIRGDDARVGIKTDGSLWMWGYAANGSFGNNLATTDTSSPVQTILGGNSWRQADTSDFSTIATKTDGTLWTWGENSNGQLGNCDIVNRSSPVQTVGSATNWKVGVVGRCHSVALKTDSSLWSWGRNQSGRLGDDTSINRSSPVQTVSAGTNWSKIATARISSFSIKTNGELWSWGGSAAGILGMGDNPDARSSPVQVLPLGTNWRQVAGGHYQAAAVKTDGTLWVWGENPLSASIAPDPNYNREFVTSAVQENSFSTDWNEVAVSKQRGGQNYGGGWVAIKCDGTLWGSGQTYFGAFGNNKFFFSVNDEQDLGDIFVWKDCFTDAGLWSWGSACGGGLGNLSTTPNISSPVQTVAGGTNWKSISAGGRPFTLATKTDGTLWVWGCGVCGTLGTNAIVSVSSPVQTISGGTNWKTVCAGYYHSVSVKSDGTLWTWGANGFGQLGDFTTTNKSSPVQTATATADWNVGFAGEEHSGGIKTDGTLWMWGNPAHGRLGNNDTVVRHSSPIQTFSAGTNWKSASLGRFHSNAIKTDGTLWTWGCNGWGQLGTFDLNNSSVPVQTVSGGTNWKFIESKALLTGSIKTDGTLWGWGRNAYGTLGNNTTIRISSPVQTVAGGTNWRRVAFSSYYSAGIKTDGTLWTWGKGEQIPMLAINDTLSRSSPVQTLVGGTNWLSVSLSIEPHAVAIRCDCW